MKLSLPPFLDGFIFPHFRLLSNLFSYTSAAEMASSETKGRAVLSSLILLLLQLLSWRI